MGLSRLPLDSIASGFFYDVTPSTPTSSIKSMFGVRSIKWMSIFAMGLLSVMANASTKINSDRHGFEVLWVHAVANAAQMIELLAVWYFAFLHLIHEAMGIVIESFGVVTSVSVLTDISTPQPTILSLFDLLHHAHAGFVTTHLFDSTEVP